MQYSKTIDRNDYHKSDLFQHVDNMTGIMTGTYTSWGTEFRKWEYGEILSALRANKAKTVLDVGGGSSMFSACAIWAGFDITVVDPEDYTEMFRQQSERIGKEIPFIHSDFFYYEDSAENKFDAVVCISTIEHVEGDTSFFFKLMRHVNKGGLLCLTTDFHESGEAVFGGHLRTYNQEMLMNMISIAKAEGFEVYGEEPDYSNFKPLVHGLYSFASMVLKRNE